MSYDIDLIMPWVDGGDLNWQKEKAQTLNIPDDNPEQGAIRYRDWDILKYWFRGVEKCLPWVRKVHFVTWGHLPEWLNVNAEKLNIVNHKDYIPEKYLPTFSANPIELNFHRIDDLAEHFIYANDDMFFISPLSEEYFFKDGLPVDCCLENAHQFFSGQIDHMIGNDLAVINKHFEKSKVLKEQKSKIFGLKQGVKPLLKNLYMKPFATFCGFYDFHTPYAYLKQTYRDVWDAEPELLDSVSSHKTRTSDDVNQWLFRYWQFATGKFSPFGMNRGKFFSIGRDDAQIETVIKNRTLPMICLNDDDISVDFDKEKAFLIECFEKAFPEKSAFEK